jgi:hypothetical protein
VILQRAVEFLPLALVLGTVLAALRHETFADIQKAALRNTAKIAAYLVAGCILLQGLLWIVQD